MHTFEDAFFKFAKYLLLFLLTVVWYRHMHGINPTTFEMLGIIILVLFYNNHRLIKEVKDERIKNDEVFRM